MDNGGAASNGQRALREDQNLIEENFRNLRELLSSDKHQWEFLGETEGVKLSRTKLGTITRC